MRCVRIWFKKMGMSRYVSHLDLMRAMSRALRRARVPLWYTEGYNPHPYMTFSLPLSLGMESLCESMDIRIVGESTNEEIFNMLTGSMPPGIEILSVEEPVCDPKHIAFGEFDILFDCDSQAQKVKGYIEKALSSAELIVQKLGKKGRHKVFKDINLMEHIRSFEISASGERVKLSLVLPAGSVTNINPSLLADEIVKNNPGIGYTIVRKKLMTEDMSVFR